MADRSEAPWAATASSSGLSSDPSWSSTTPVSDEDVSAQPADATPHSKRHVPPANWSEEEEGDDSDDHDLTGVSANLRTSLKIIRDPNRTAFDVLPSGETLGSFANRHAIDRYARKVESKRERARETRLKKRKSVKSLRRPEKTALVGYGRLTGAHLESQAVPGVGAR